MTTKANAIHRARELAREKQETVYVVFDPDMIEYIKFAYYAATAEQVDTFYQGCQIVAAVEPEELCSHDNPDHRQP